MRSIVAKIVGILAVVVIGTVFVVSLWHEHHSTPQHECPPVATPATDASDELACPARVP